MASLAAPRNGGLATRTALVASPVIVIFLSSNFVNVGNLLFNVLFSRWMGPVLYGDLAILLTIKLALLGVLGALGSAVSHRVAHSGQDDGQAIAVVNRFLFVGLWLSLPLIALALYAGSVPALLELEAATSLYILLLSLPFCAPLNVLRGVAMGRLDAQKIVYSANIEMAVRLGFGVLAWQTEFGIGGVVAGIALSIVAGWAVLTNLLPQPRMPVRAVRPVMASLGMAALPFALLQVAQVATLDGDIFLATRSLGDIETGYVAALSLFQRIQFFACFSLAGVLLPAVVIAVRENRPPLSGIALIVGLITIVSAIMLTLSLAVPEALLGLLVGADYAAAAPHLIWVAGAAVLFTINYLIATYMLAIGLAGGVATVVVGAIVQLGLMSVAVSAPGGDLAAMLAVKLACQAGVLVVLLVQLGARAAFTIKP